MVVKENEGRESVKFRSIKNAEERVKSISDNIVDITLQLINLINQSSLTLRDYELEA
jgi:hypothetical protein